MTGAWLEVLDPGPLTTVQDRGRPGLAHLGIAPSGALDRPAADLANRLVGNPPTAAVLETTLAGPRLRLSAGAGVLVVAVTGAPTDVRIDGRARDHDATLFLRAGSVLEVGRARAGVRSYLAVRGGVEVEAVLGSRSCDVLSGLGPPPLRSGDRLPIGSARGPVPALDSVPRQGLATRPQLLARPGPRHDWFDPAALALLTTTSWLVGQDSNRVGLRLVGPALPRCRHDQLPPEGMVTGSLQVPPDGQPVLLLADHPTTGGYPVIAVVDEAGLASAAQARPGTALLIRLTRPPAAAPVRAPTGTMGAGTLAD